MSLQWVAVAGFLYLEIGLSLLLILPLLQPKVWKWIFSMKIFSTIQPLWSTMYYTILLILVILFIDSIRTMVKYGDIPVESTMTLDAKLDRLFRECKGQRNFYITGFALFLILVIRRLITMLSERAQLEASHEATLRQARAANAELTRRIESEGKKDEADAGPKTKKEKTPKDKKEKESPSVETLQEDLKKARADLDAMKKQAQSTNREYDRLAEENQKLQNRVQELEGEKESKKDQ